MQKRLFFTFAYVLIILALLFGSTQYSNYRNAQDQKKLDSRGEDLKSLMSALLSNIRMENLPAEALARQDYTDEHGKQFANLEYTFSTFSEQNPFTKNPSSAAVQFEKELLKKGFSYDPSADINTAFWDSKTYVRGDVFCDIARGTKFSEFGTPTTSGEYVSCSAPI